MTLPKSTDSDVGDLENLIHCELPIDFTWVDLDDFHLELLPPGTTPEAVASAVAAGTNVKLDTTATLCRRRHSTASLLMLKTN